MTRTCFDVETAPLDDAADYLTDIEPPKTHTKEATIAKWRAEQLSRCSLDPDLSSIIAIGLQSENGHSGYVLKTDDDSERGMLSWFWSTVKGQELVGFNIRQFDLQIMLRRSLYLDIEAPQLSLDRYRHAGIVDLLDELTFNGATKMRSLSFYCKRFGFPCPPDEITGADIGQAYLEKNWLAIENHVRSDVMKAVLLAERLGKFERSATGLYEFGAFGDIDGPVLLAGAAV